MEIKGVEHASDECQGFLVGKLAEKGCGMGAGARGA
jgi:hypothetical protein